MSGQTRSAAPPETGFPGAGDRGGVSGLGGNVLGYVGAPALATLRVAAAGEDGETVTIGADVYELDTHVVEDITAGRVRVDVSGGATVASEALLTIVEAVTATDDMDIGGENYLFVAGATAAAGEIGLGAGEAETKLAIVEAINGTDGFNTPNASCTIAAFIVDDAILTALVPGTVGDAILLAESFTDVGNIFDDSNFGTETAGVDPTAGEVSDALIVSINANANGAENVLAVDISANEILIMTADKPGGTPVPSTKTTALAESLAGTNNAWDTAALRVGQGVGARRFVMETRTPNAQEVALGTMHIACPGFTPTGALVMVITTSTGIAVAWVGATLFADNRCTLDNTGAVDFAETDTVFVFAWE